VRLAWYAHRGLYRVTGGRVGLWRAKAKSWGTLRLTTTGRRTGAERSVIIGYLDDGPDLIALAMNGWAGGEPAWWLNLQAFPTQRSSSPTARAWHLAHAAHGDERSRLWARWREIDDGYFAALRSSETAVVVLESRSDPTPSRRQLIRLDSHTTLGTCPSPAFAPSRA
jgi:deazaflavin-dependent oxidoreductase (nitroreductase family)